MVYCLSLVADILALVGQYHQQRGQCIVPLWLGVTSEEMRALVRGEVVLPWHVSNQLSMAVRSYVWWSLATTGSAMRSCKIGHSMYLGQSGRLGVFMRNAPSAECMQSEQRCRF
jgi:hypothetical protein